MNKLRGTRSTGCKGKAGKEGGSKQGQTGTDEKAKGRSRGGWGWAENGENAGNTGNAGNRRWKQKSQEMYTGNAQYKKRLRNRFRSLLSSASRPSGAASGILPYSAGCSAGVSAGACVGISAWGIVAGASVSRTRS